MSTVDEKIDAILERATRTAEIYGDILNELHRLSGTGVVDVAQHKNDLEAHKALFDALRDALSDKASKTEVDVISETLSEKLSRGDLERMLEGKVDASAIPELLQNAEALLTALQGKADATDTETALSKKADASVVKAALAEKADTSSLQEGLSQKADADAMERALAGKADAAAVQEALTQKADSRAVDAALAKKVDTTVFQEAVTQKADAEAVREDLKKKADTVDVEKGLAQKADTSAVEALLGRRIIAGLGLKGGGSLEDDVTLHAHYQWDESVTYAAPCLLLGKDGGVYRWKAPSGPDIKDTGVKEPGQEGSENYWTNILAGISQNILSGWRETMAGTPLWWPSHTVPILADGLPYGLPLDGAPISLETYPRLTRVLCPLTDNAWMPAWYRCDGSGQRSPEGTHIKLDDWRDGYPQVVGDPASSQHGSTVLVSTTDGSSIVTVTNNLSDGGTLLTPKVSTGNIYPGLRITGAGIPAGATVVSVSEATVTLSAAATATAVDMEATVWGRVLGSWQGDALRSLHGIFGKATETYSLSFTKFSGAFAGVGENAGHAGFGHTGGCPLVDFNSSRVIPTAPTTRPAGPAATAIIIV